MTAVEPGDAYLLASEPTRSETASTLRVEVARRLASTQRPRSPILERSARRSTQDKIADTREFSMCAPGVLYARSRTIWRRGYVRAFGPRDRIDGTSRIGNPMEGLGGCCGVDRSVSGPGGRILAAQSSPALGGGRSAELGPQRGVMRR